MLRAARRFRSRSKNGPAEACSRRRPLRVPLAIGFFTGMRLGEVLGLRWPQINLLANVITLNAGETKNDSGRTAPICGELRTLLVEQRAKRQPDCEWVCFKIGRTGHAERVVSFRKAWYSSCVRAGLGSWTPVVDADGKPVFETLRGPRSKPKQKQEWSGAIFHDLRRSGVKSMLDAGVQEDTAMKISGHKTRSMLTRYNIQSPKNIETAGKLLDAYNAKLAREAAEENSHSLATVDAFSGVAKNVN
jgi:integrase